jgi:amino acid adenylation domain-containing protein/non-ribosomal peptide synthase protein (TIGR01720 family)
MTTLEELKHRAKTGDLESLQILRDSGFFQKQKAAKEGYAVSYAQKRLWILDQMEEHSAAYNIPGALRLEGSLNTKVFKSALEAVVARHESLRTTFINFNNELRQLIHTKNPFRLEEIDLSLVNEAEKIVQEYVYQDAASSFDLQTGPLLRAKLFKLAPEQHVFVFNIHHIVCDAWSMEVLVREVMTLYAAYLKGAANPLLPLKIQYKDYAAWHNAQIESREAQLHHQYWHRQLSGPLPILPLPTDYSRPPVLTFSGKTLSCHFDSPWADQLKKLGREHGASLFMTLVALVKVLLYRYSGQPDIIIGTPIAGRDHPDLEDQIGCFVNTLALRDRLVGEQSFVQTLKCVKQTTESAYEHQIYPFDLLVSELNLNRDVSRSPIFDVMVVLQNIETTNFSLGEVKISEFDSGFRVAKFDLTFEFVETSEGLWLALNYNTNLFSESRINNMAGHFQQLLLSIMENVHTPISTLNILSSTEKQRLLVEFNNTRTNYPRDKTLIALFEKQVDETPDNIAIIFAEEEGLYKRITYRELNERANYIAWHLIKQHQVKTDERIAVLLDRSDWMVVGLLGILKAGGAYVPIDPSYPDERIHYMLEDSGCRVVLTETRYIPRSAHQEPTENAKNPWVNPDSSKHLDGNHCHWIDIHTLPTESSTNPPLLAQPDHAAYVIYTSGSTGQPKGCLITHRNVVRLMQNDQNCFDFNQEDVWVVAHSFCFDFSVWEMYGALLNGGKAIIAKPEEVQDVERFLELLKQHRVTVLNQTPAAFYNLIETEGTSAQSHLNEHLRYVILGGDRLEPTYLRAWIERYSLDKIQLINMYGITETTVHVTYYQLREEDIFGTAGRSPIGVPLPETTVYVCNEQLALQPLGISGELYVGGSGVSQGYLNQPDLTAKRFITSPYHQGELLYRTGDLGRWLANGTLEYLGRNDDQVQVRGFRVELGEIEQHLLAANRLEKAVVLARESNGTQELVAYLVALEPLHVPNLRHHLSQKLPDYMIPTHFIWVDEIPLTSNGKVDKRALLQLTDNRQQLSEETFVAPSTPMEERLADLWTNILGVERVGIHDDFFELGGHSLKGTQLVSKIRNDLEIKMGLRDLFESPTIAKLAKVIQNRQPTALIQIEPVPIAEHYAVSNAQRRLWILEQMGADIAAYNITGSNLLEGQIKVEALEKALQILVARHESLRTTFIEFNEEPRQVIRQNIDFKVEIVDLTVVDNPEPQAQQLVNQEAAKAYDLKTGPLFKVKLYHLGAERYVFLLSMHHIISDGWSLEIFVKELLILYKALVAKRDHPLPPLRIQYKDYAQWQNSQLADTQANNHRDYWLKQFSGAIPILELPTDYPRPLVQTFRGGMQTLLLSSPQISHLKKLGQAQGASLFMTLLALVKVLMYRYTGQEDIIIGSPVAGRDHPDLANQIGFYVNMLALRDTIQAPDTFVRVLDKVKNTVTSAFDHQIYPFDRLVEELELQRDMGRNPLFDVAINLVQSIGGIDSELSTLQISPFEVETAISKFDLTFVFGEWADGRCEVGIEYSTDLFSPERMERMAAHLAELVKSVLEAPHQAISHLNILPQWERQQVLVEFNDTYSDYPRDQTIAQVFEAQVETTPANLAVICGETQLTYQALNQRANSIARLLREKYQIKPEEGVGVLLDRSEWTVVALVSILKAGGAYVPIDPAYPHNRIAYILKDTNCRLVLSEPKHLVGVLSNFPDIQAIAIQTFDETVDSNLKPVGNGSSLAYVIYTSGSTGLPKGSLIEQKSVLRLVLNTNYININESDRILPTGSLAFDASTFEIWGSLLNGAGLCLPPKPSLLETTELKRILQQYEVTTIWLTSSLFNQLLDADISMFKGLKNLLTGGEKLSAVHIRKVREAYPNLTVINGYGPTENTTFTTCYRIEDHFETDIPIGSPITNTTVYILDSNGQPAPIGVPGEICTGGEGLARGYLNQPYLTAEKFVPNPFKANEQLYRTGDLGYWLPDGNIVFIGRIDNQVKVRGFRIEPGEIEERLQKHPAVKEAVVIARKTTVGTQELIAYVSSETALIAAELRSHLAETLPNYMIPAHIVRLDQLPLTVNGKIDKRALPEPEALESKSNTTYIAPNSHEETILAKIWEGVLGQKPIGVHDNYFELGGDSIKAIQITSRLRREGWQIEVRDLFHHPTIAELVPRLHPTETQPESPNIITGQVPLTAIQRWFFTNHHGDLHHFNQAVLLRSYERLDENQVRQVLQQLQEHHDALRMTYQKTTDVSPTLEGEERAISQINVGLEQPLSFEVVDLTTTANEVKELESHADSIQASLVLETGPLMKAVLYQLTTGSRLLLVIHHLMVDGVSWRILIEDIEQGYRQATAGDEIHFGTKTVSFKRWAEEVQRYATGEALLPENTYWSAVLEETIATPLPRDFESKENLYGDCQSAAISFSESETQSLLTGTHHAYYTEINEILLTALGRALKRWHGGEATWVTMEGHGRETLTTALDISRTVGWFTSMYPVLLKTSGDDISYQIKQVKETLRQIPNKGVGFGILNYLTPPSQPERNPVFLNHGTSNAQLSFNYLGQFDDGGDNSLLTFANESFGQLISPNLQRHHDLDVVGMIVRGQLNLSIIFNSQRHQAKTMEKLLADFKEELVAIVEHCQNQLVGEKTPSDFTVPTLFSLEPYDAFLQAHTWEASQIEDIYPLSLMQEGLLFESLYDADSTAYFVQISYRLKGALLIDNFKHSWYELTRCYAVLRTAFIHENVARPLQVVFKDRMPEIVVMDWRDLTATEQQARIEAYQGQDRARGFDFQRETLLRIRIFQLSESQYQIVWSYHHILLDGWCLGILYQDFAKIYAALGEGKTPKLPVTPPYSEYIRWLEQQDRNEAINYWSHYLSGYEHVTTLPKWHRPEPMSDYVLKEKTFALGDTAKLKALAASQGVTVNTIIQSLWGVILSRYNNVDDVVFGTIVSGRPATLSGVEQMVGLFINAIPVRIQYQTEQPLLEILQAVQKASLESEPYHYCPLVEVQAQSIMGRDLFDHVLIFENYPMDIAVTQSESDAAKVTIENLAVHDRTHYNFDVTIVPGDPIEIKFSFNGNIYLEDQIARMVAHFQTALQHLLQSPNQSVGSVQILPQLEQQQLLDQFNNTAMDYPRDQTFVSMFEEQVKKYPNRVAVVFEEVQLTYQTLNGQANQLAHYLRNLGISPEKRVGICVERSLEMIIGVLGILKAGGAYVPLDPLYPKERLAFMLEDSQVSVLLTQQRLELGMGEWSLVIENKIPVVYLDTDWANISTNQPSIIANDLLAVAQPEHLAYVIYTSGSTGKPKGVMVEHGNLVNAAYAWQQAYHLNEFEVRLLQIASLSFDVFAADLIRTLTNGGQLIICPSEILFEPDLFYQLLTKHHINIFDSTPGLIIPLMDYIQENSLNIDFLKLLIIGSDSLPFKQYKILQDQFGAQTRIINCYGVTEASIDSSYFEGKPSNLMQGITPIGKPLANTQFYVLDFKQRLLPIGVFGELYIGGEGVARGYLNRPTLTAERFVSHPFSKQGERLYRTGDLVRWLPDGNLEFQERVDNQVKIRGYRIELGEIENQLLRHPSVDKAVVVSWLESGQAPALVAYIVVSGEPDTINIREYLQATLPDYMVPSFFIKLDKLPLTPNGKINKNALPAPTETDIDRTVTYTAPRDRLETQLVHIWQSILQIENIGIFDNFFELGGHSLKAMQVVSRIHQILGVKITLRNLFGSPTITELAAQLKTAESSVFYGIEPVPTQADYELSYAQKRLWILHQMGESASVAYNMPQVFLFEEMLDTEALKQAFATLVERHEALRTAFVEIESEPRQKIYPSIDFSVSEVDISTQANVDEKAQERVDKEANTAFDLTKPPLLRATLLKLGENRYVFIMIMHHIIGDGWSMNVLYREIMALYSAYCQGQPNPLKPLRIQYKDFAVWQNAKGFEREEQYWLNKLAGVPQQLRLPYDFPATAERKFRGDVEKIFLEVNVTQELQTLAIQKHTSISNVMLALFKLLLFQLTKQEDFCVGLGIANRNHPELENLIGFFVNTLPIRTHCSEEMEFEELLQQVSQSTQEALEYQDYPLDLLVNKLNPRRVCNRQPLLNVVYAFQNETNVYIDVGTSEKEIMVTSDLDNPKGLDVSFKISKFDLTLVVTDYGNTLHLYLEYDTELFLPTTIQRYLAMLQHFARIVAN